MKPGSRGFSYIEMLMALALFAIVLAAVLPTLAQAGHNMAYARSSYAAHLQAHNLMLAVRDTLAALPPPQRGCDYEVAHVAGHAAHGVAAAQGIGGFSIWLDDALLVAHHAPEAAMYVTGFNMLGSRYLVTVVVWDANHNPAGRAMGVL